MPSELRPVVRAASLRAAVSGGPWTHEGRVGDVHVLAATTGVGTARAAAATRRALAAAPVDRVIVVGIAGAVDPSLAIGSVLAPGVVVDGATGRRLQPVPLPGLPTGGMLETSDAFISDAAGVAALRARGVVAVDMETAAIGAVCEEHGIAWSVVRAMSDRAGETRPDVLGLLGPDGTPRVGKAARLVLTQPWRVFELARLGAGARTAALAAARAAVEACRRLGSA